MSQRSLSAKPHACLLFLASALLGSVAGAKPDVVISSPMNGSAIGGNTQVVVAFASKGAPVASIELLIDGQSVHTKRLKEQAQAGSQPFEWNTKLLGDAVHTLTAKVYDTKGEVGASSVTVYVSNNEKDTYPPSVAITKPRNGETVSGTIEVGIDARDNKLLDYVFLFVDGTMKLMKNYGPFSFQWNTVREDNGAHTLLAKATDASQNMGESPKVTVIVNNEGGQTRMGAQHFTDAGDGGSGIRDLDPGQATPDVKSLISTVPEKPAPGPSPVAEPKADTPSTDDAVQTPGPQRESSPAVGTPTVRTPGVGQTAPAIGAVVLTPGRRSAQGTAPARGDTGKARPSQPDVAGADTQTTPAVSTGDQRDDTAQPVRIARGQSAPPEVAGAVPPQPKTTTQPPVGTKLDTPGLASPQATVRTTERPLTAAVHESRPVAERSRPPVGTKLDTPGLASPQATVRTTERQLIAAVHESRPVAERSRPQPVAPGSADRQASAKATVEPEGSPQPTRIAMVLSVRSAEPTETVATDGPGGIRQPDGLPGVHRSAVRTPVTGSPEATVVQTSATERPVAAPPRFALATGVGTRPLPDRPAGRVGSTATKVHHAVTAEPIPTSFPDTPVETASPKAETTIAMLPRDHGRDLTVPKAGPLTVRKTHTVQVGENLSRIARLYDVSVLDLALSNDLQDMNLIRAGQSLVIPNRSLQVFYDSHPLKVDVAPFAEAGIPMAPFRSIYEHAGGSVVWVHNTKTVEAKNDEHTVRLKIDSRKAQVDGESILMELAALIKQNRTMVPASLFTKALSVEVHFDPSTGQIMIASK